MHLLCRDQKFNKASKGLERHPGLPQLEEVM